MREQVRALGDAVDRNDLEEDRRVWLSAQLAALDTALAVLAGQRFSYRQLVERCHGVAPVFVAESRFAAAHELLADALPGNGDVRERYQRWAASQRVPAERLLTGLRALAEELRSRTGELVGLAQGEEVIFELVRDKPWAGNADYLGDFRTRVRISKTTSTWTRSSARSPADAGRRGILLSRGPCPLPALYRPRPGPLPTTAARTADHG